MNGGWSRLPSLRKLDMSGNHLCTLPEAVGSFPSLTHMTLEYNQLGGDCLKALGALPKLEILGLANNQISEIPEEAFTAASFNHLLVLDVSRNSIRFVCDECALQLPDAVFGSGYKPSP
jgi:Leucine-rich repeat (LRR) protein